MKYLDAKKRLALMMATAKYVKLYMDANPNIEVTNEDIKLALAKALLLLPKDYVTTVEDLAIVTEGVKSLLLEAKAKNLKFSSEATLTTRHYDTIKVDDLFILNEYLKIHGIDPTTIATDEILNTIITLNNINIAVDQASRILSDDKIKFSEEHLIAAGEPNYLRTADLLNIVEDVTLIPSVIHELELKSFIDVEDELKLNHAAVNNISFESVFSTVGKITMELQEIKSTFGSDDFIKFKANVLLQSIAPLALAANEAIKNTTDVNINVNNSDLLSSNTKIKTLGKLYIDYLLCLSLELAGSAKITNKFNLAVNKSVSIIHEAQILLEYSAKLVDRMSRYLGINTNILTSGEMAMEFEEFVAVEFGMDGIFTVKDVVELNKSFPLPTKIIAKLYVPNEVKLGLINGADIMHDYTLTIKDSVTLGRFKYALLRDFDESYLSDIEELFLDDMIYITTD